MLLSAHVQFGVLWCLLDHLLHQRAQWHARCTWWCGTCSSRNSNGRAGPAVAVGVCRAVQHQERATANDAARESVTGIPEGTARECEDEPEDRNTTSGPHDGNPWVRSTSGSAGAHSGPVILSGTMRHRTEDFWGRHAER